MIGVILFWIDYIIAAILLYTILRCSYNYVLGPHNKYVLSETRKKHPLWFIILFGLVFLIPVINIIVLITYIGGTASATCKGDRIYYKSFLFKEY